MGKIILSGAREKFLNARELCPNMDEKLYFVTDYIGSIIGDKITPIDLIDQVLSIVGHMLGVGTIDSTYDVCTLGYLLKIMFYATEVKKQIVRFPQVVDALADEKFATVFRKLWDELSVFISLDKQQGKMK